MKTFAIFKKGKWKDSQGRDFEADDAKLAKILEVNQGRPAPFVIGHPKVSSPKWGEASAFSREGDLLMATPSHVVPEFAEWVKKKLWDKISISLNEDLTIRHIGFLGATPPAVAGMPDVEFSADDKALNFEFAKGEMPKGKMKQMLADMMKKMQDMMGQMDDEPIDDKHFSKEEHMAKTVEELEAELAAEKAKVAEFAKTGEKVKTLETELATERAKNQVAEFSAFCVSDDMRTKISPAMQPAVIDFMQLLAGTETFEFSAADPADKAKTVKVKKAPVEAFKEFCKTHLPDIIEFSEVATKTTATGATDATAREAAINEFSKAHPDMSYTNVVLEVSKVKPELFKDR